MTLLTRMTGVILVFGAIICSMGSGGQIIIFVDIPSAIFVGGVVLGGLLMACNPSDVRRGVINSFIGRPAKSPDDFTRQLAAMRCGYFLAWGAGIVGTLLGLVIMLSNMDDPSKIGPGMAVSLLCAVYGVILAEFGFNLFAHMLMSHNDGYKNDLPAGGPRNNLGLGAAIILGALLLFAIMIIAMSEYRVAN